jgi:TolB protein
MPTSKKNKSIEKDQKNIVNIIKLVIILIVAFGVTSSLLQYKQRLDEKKPWKTYSSLLYMISFQYPPTWKPLKDVEDRYQGRDGFFQIGLISGEGMTLDSVTNEEAYRQLAPYGTTPTIKPLMIAKQGARLIIPSQDQDTIMREQTAVIIQSPRPLTISASVYNYYILWGDKAHIDEIANTMTFTGLLADVIGKSPSSGTVNEPVNKPTTYKDKIVRFDVIAKDSDGAHVEEKTYAIYNAQAWEEVWNTIYANESDVPPVPAIDFKKKMVLGYFLGKKTTGGYAVEIKQITEKADALEIVLQKTAPGENCAVTLALTSPYTLVSLSKIEKEISVIVKEDAIDCSEE